METTLDKSLENSEKNIISIIVPSGDEANVILTQEKKIVLLEKKVEEYRIVCKKLLEQKQALEAEKAQFKADFLAAITFLSEKYGLTSENITSIPTILGVITKITPKLMQGANALKIEFEPIISIFSKYFSPQETKN